jgi:hypothetical protein
MARPVRLILVLIGIIAGIPGLAFAQPAGWYLYPTLSFGERYDDNIFDASESKTSDFITLISGTLGGGYQSVPLTVLGYYSVTAEVYADHSELNNFGDNQSARLLFSYLPDPRWILGLTADFERLTSPSQLFLRTPSPAPISGPTPAPTPSSTGQVNIPTPFVPAVDAGRAETTLIEVNPSVSYRFDPRTTGAVQYLYTRSEVDDEVTTGHEARVSLGRQLTVRDTGSLNYDFRFFDSTDEQAEAADNGTSHAVTLGWTRELTALTSMRLAAGPSFTEGDVGVDVFAGIDHRFRRGTVGLSYEHTQSVVVGIGGASNVDQVIAYAVFQPCRLCSATVNGSFGNYSPVEETGAAGFRVYTVGASFSYLINSWLAARASYDFSYQDSDGTVTSNNIVSVHLDFFYPFRVY